MGKTWFSVRVVYNRTNEKGIKVKAKELYLLDALSFTEAEARAIGEMKPFAEDELRVTAMKIEDIAEIFNSENEGADKWYRIKVHFITVDNEDKQKKTAHIYLVKGAMTEDAMKILHERMKGTLIDYVIHSATEAQYMDVFFYSLDGENEFNR